jgi:hypothetical protein
MEPYLGHTVKKARLLEAIQAPFFMSNRGGAISRAMTLAMAGVFPTCYWPTSNADTVFADDVIVSSDHQDVIKGMMAVTDLPGLGLRLDHARLERLKGNVPDPRHDMMCVVKSTYPDGTVMYNPGLSYVVHPGWISMGPFGGKIGFAEVKTTEYIDDDGSDAWASVAAEFQRQGVVEERQSGMDGGGTVMWKQGGGGRARDWDDSS